jgi:steroid delta-isomerase-like uncharacterized protein
MSPETNIATVRRMIEQVYNKRRLDLVEEFFSADIVQHIVGYPLFTGLEALRQNVAMGLNGFPDFRLTVEDEVAAGDKVAARWTMTGTQKGEVFGIPATGKQVVHSGMTFYRLSNAKIAELWFLADTLGMMQQLGVIPQVAA